MSGRRCRSAEWAKEGVVRSRVLLVALTLVSLLAPALAGAANIGVRAGSSLTGRDTYTNRELFLSTGLPWTWGDATSDGWHAATDIELAVGEVRDDDNELTNAGLMLNLAARKGASPFSLRIGAGPTYISEKELAGRRFGGPLQFSTYIGLYLDLGRRFTLGYRLQHTSNGGIYDVNQGMDLQVVELRLRF